MAVKEFSGDVRRAYELAELAPGLDLLVGSDDVTLELGGRGRRRLGRRLPERPARRPACGCGAPPGGDLARPLPLYRPLHPLLRWDARTEFVQAIKLSMDLAGRYGGPCRPPRLPLLPDQEAEVREATEKVLAEGLR